MGYAFETAGCYRVSRGGKGMSNEYSQAVKTCMLSVAVDATDSFNSLFHFYNFLLNKCVYDSMFCVAGGSIYQGN